MTKAVLVVLLLSAPLGGCVTPSTAGVPLTATLPAYVGWYKSHKVIYVTTDISDAALSARMRSNFAPRLLDGVPEYPKPAEVRTVLERVYKFAGDTQGSVFASAPEPLGEKSRDKTYSPLWIVYSVRWIDPAQPRILQSEEALLEAQGLNQVAIERTDIVVNCPVVGIDDQSLPGVKIIGPR